MICTVDARFCGFIASCSPRHMAFAYKSIETTSGFFDSSVQAVSPSPDLLMPNSILTADLKLSATIDDLSHFSSVEFIHT